MKKKREKPEDFIGWKSPDGKLEVVGIIEKSKHTTFKVTCTECSKDKALFPDGYFVSQKGDLVRGRKPCGCSKKPEWFDWQYLILARINDIINIGNGCPKCAGNARPTEQEALQKCVDICKEMDYNAVGFVDGYKGAHKTRFEYICKIHGKQNASYHDFVNGGRRCGVCAKDLGNGNGYYPERKDETDFLYILNFNGKFIKVGRSFDVNERLKDLRTLSKTPIKKIHKLRIFTATHQEVYDLEQELHSELRERNFQHYVDWSTECFENDSQFILNKLLDNCGLTEIEIRG